MPTVWSGCSPDHTALYRLLDNGAYLLDNDLVGSFAVDDDSVHLHMLAQPLANQSLHVLTPHTAGRGLAGRQRVRRCG
jgi:hypothetical protein